MRRREMWGALSGPARFLIVNQFGVWLGFFLVVPLLATRGTVELGISSAAVGLVLGWRTFSQQGLMFGAGLFADRIGLRAALLIGSAARSVSLVMLAFAEQLWSLLVAITVFGLAGSLIAPSTRAYLGVAAGARRSEAFSLFNSASVLGSAVGPLVAVAASPLGFETTCLLAALVFTAMAVGQLLVLPPAPQPTAPSLGRAVLAILRSRRLLLFSAAASGQYAVWNGAFLLLPLEATRLTGHAAVGTGAVFVLIAVTTVVLQVRLLTVQRRLGSIRAAAAGIALTAVGFGAVVLTRAGWPEDVVPVGSGWPGAAVLAPVGLLLAGTVVIAAGNALAVPPIQDLTAALAPPGQVAAAYGINGLFAGTVSAVVVPLVGRVDDFGQVSGHRWTAPALVCLVALGSALAVRQMSRDLDS
ncbi:MFS transporter [Kribbella sp. CA-253562]|uniref:MFS transporter n=1 Tax=Kribbella sp. CA-253562 TaxID=3239942 RepID=UPI003D89F561